MTSPWRPARGSCKPRTTGQPVDSPAPSARHPSRPRRARRRRGSDWGRASTRVVVLCRRAGPEGAGGAGSRRPSPAPGPRRARGEAPPAGLSGPRPSAGWARRPPWPRRLSTRTGSSPPKDPVERPAEAGRHPRGRRWRGPGSASGEDADHGHLREQFADVVGAPRLGSCLYDEDKGRGSLAARHPLRPGPATWLLGGPGPVCPGHRRRGPGRALTARSAGAGWPAVRFPPVGRRYAGKGRGRAGPVRTRPSGPGRPGRAAELGPSGTKLRP